MNARFEDGELLDITLKGVRVGGNGIPASERKLYVDLGPWSSGIHRGSEWFVTLPVDSPKVVVSRVAPREWPPQPGDVWVGADETQFFARTGDDGDAQWLVPVGGGSISSYPDEILASYGPLSLAYRRGWSPEPAPVAEVDEREKLDKRAEVIAGLREMADWFEANSGVPIDLYGWEMLSCISRATDEAEHAELLRVADLIGEPADLTATHPRVKKTFRGRVSYHAYYIPTAKPAAKDIAGEGGEAAGPDGAGPAAAPAEQPPAEQVWVATVRQGITYHRGGLIGQTMCGRATRTGGLLGLPEAVALSGEACKRCWPDGHDTPGGDA